MEHALHPPHRATHRTAVEDVAPHRLVREVEILQIGVLTHRQPKIVAALGEQTGNLGADEARATREERLRHHGKSSHANPSPTPIPRACGKTPGEADGLFG